MHAGALGRQHHFFRIDLAEAGDVFADRAGKQFDILRQVADVRAQFGLVPVIDVGAVQAHLAHCAGHTPTSRRASVDLPEPLGPITPSTSPGAIAKLRFSDHRIADARRRRGHAFDAQRTSGFGSGMPASRAGLSLSRLVRRS